MLALLLRTDEPATPPPKTAPPKETETTSHITKTQMGPAGALVQKISYNLSAFRHAGSEEERKKYAAWISYDLAELGRMKMNKSEREQAMARISQMVSDVEREAWGSGAKIGALEQVVKGLLDAGPKWKSVNEQAETALAGQIRYLSTQEKNMTAQAKVELLFGLEPLVALRPAVMQAVVKSYDEQTAYISVVENDVWEAGLWARDYKPYTAGGFGVGPVQIRYDPPASELLTEQRARDQKRDNTAWPKGDSVPAEKLHLRMAEMAIHYFEAQAAAARLMGQKTDNPVIRDLAANLEAEARSRLLKAHKLGGTPQERREALLLLVEYSHSYLQPALSKMETEKYFADLYKLAGNTTWKKALVWANEHAQTGMLWSALAMGAINPLAGRMAFMMMGSRDVVMGVENKDWNQTLMGTTMLVGLGGLGRVSQVAGGVLVGTVVLGTAEQVESGARTGFTPRDWENLANSAVLLEGFFRARMERSGQKSRIEKKTGKQKKSEEETKTEKTEPKQLVGDYLNPGASKQRRRIEHNKKIETWEEFREEYMKIKEERGRALTTAEIYNRKALREFVIKYDGGIPAIRQRLTKDAAKATLEEPQAPAPVQTENPVTTENALEQRLQRGLKGMNNKTLMDVEAHDIKNDVGQYRPIIRMLADIIEPMRTDPTIAGQPGMAGRLAAMSARSESATASLGQMVDGFREFSDAKGSEGRAAALGKLKTGGRDGVESARWLLAQAEQLEKALQQQLRQLQAQPGTEVEQKAVRAHLAELEGAVQLMRMLKERAEFGLANLAAFRADVKGVYQPKLEALDVGAYVGKMVGALQAKTSGVEFRMEGFDGPAGAFVAQADQVLLKNSLNQVLGNAMGYAQDAHPQGGAMVTVRLFSAPDGVRIEVEDNGIGMSRTEAANAFVKGVKNANQLPGGTGFGLNFAKNAVEGVMGGRIWVDFKPAEDRSSRFEILLPRKPGGGGPEGAPPSVPLKTAPVRTLDEFVKKVGQQAEKMDALAGNISTRLKELGIQPSEKLQTYLHQINGLSFDIRYDIQKWKHNQSYVTFDGKAPEFEPVRKDVGLLSLNASRAVRELELLASQNPDFGSAPDPVWAKAWGLGRQWRSPEGSPLPVYRNLADAMRELEAIGLDMRNLHAQSSNLPPAYEPPPTYKKTIVPGASEGPSSRASRIEHWEIPAYKGKTIEEINETRAHFNLQPLKFENGELVADPAYVMMRGGTAFREGGPNRPFVWAKNPKVETAQHSWKFGPNNWVVEGPDGKYYLHSIGTYDRPIVKRPNGTIVETEKAEKFYNLAYVRKTIEMLPGGARETPKFVMAPIWEGFRLYVPERLILESPAGFGYYQEYVMKGGVLAETGRRVAAGELRPKTEAKTPGETRTTSETKAKVEPQTKSAPRAGRNIYDILADNTVSLEKLKRYRKIWLKKNPTSLMTGTPAEKTLKDINQAIQKRELEEGK